MNALQQQLYNDLMNLVNSDEAFFYSDQIVQSETFRIFNYRLASYSQWLLSHALECRGITFVINDDGEPVRLASWPFEKFFNINENPMTMDLELNGVKSIQEKMDGSLISTYVSDGAVRLKSKGSLFSDQAMAAQRLLEDDTYLLHVLQELAVDQNLTVIMEYTAPSNRIVVDYPGQALTVLAVRDNYNGSYVKADVRLKDYMVEDHVHMVDDVNGFVADIPNMIGIEGFVLVLNNDQRVKIKTEWYSKLHHLKDSINSERRLFEAIVYDTVDDIKAQFWDDSYSLNRINDMEGKVASIYNHMVDQVERFYERNKHMDRKDFAIKGQRELNGLHFGLAMAKYSGKEVDYRHTMIKHRKDFGIKDDKQR